jgi:dCMP deaminase
MRISRHMMWMEMAEIAARRSTCYRGNTGAVIVEDRRIISIGYNGPPSGEEHCKGNDCELRDGGCARSIHAEVNAIDRMQSSSNGCDLYCTSAPCLACAEAIVKTMISRIFYRYPYRLDTGLRFLLERLPIYRLTPSGIVVDGHTGDIVELET